MLDFIHMLLIRLDPFKVYRAERALRAHGIRLPRDVLINHYLVMGQLETLTARLLEHTGERAGDWWEELTAVDIKQAKGLQEGAFQVPAAASSHNPLHRLFHPETFSDVPIRHPLAAAIWNSIVGTLFAAAVATFISIWQGVIGFPISWTRLAYVEGGLIATCWVHAFLGSRVGGQQASKILGLVFGLGMVVAVYYLTQS